MHAKDETVRGSVEADGCEGRSHEEVVVEINNVLREVGNVLKLRLYTIAAGPKPV